MTMVDNDTHYNLALDFCVQNYNLDSQDLRHSVISTVVRTIQPLNIFGTVPLDKEVP